MCGLPASVPLLIVVIAQLSKKQQIGGTTCPFQMLSFKNSQKCDRKKAELAHIKLVFLS